MHERERERESFRINIAWVSELTRRAPLFIGANEPDCLGMWAEECWSGGKKEMRGENVRGRIWEGEREKASVMMEM